MGQLAPSVGKEPPLYLLAGIGAIFAGLTVVTPFAFQAGVNRVSPAKIAPMPANR